MISPARAVSSGDDSLSLGLDMLLTRPLHGRKHVRRCPESRQYLGGGMLVASLYPSVSYLNTEEPFGRVSWWSSGGHLATAWFSV